MNEELMQDLLEGGGGGGGSIPGFATGTTCANSGTYRATNKYLNIILVVEKGEVFPPFSDGKKTTWYALTASSSSNKGGSFESVRVAPGTI
jgi:hypothetical protein